MGEVGPGPCRGFLVPVHWWVELGLVSLLGRAASRGMFRGKVTLGSLTAYEWACVLICWLFGLRCPSTGACRLF